ncbi:Pycsar system effector family protein [Micromonospora lupini]|uniref:Pycsar system effector family protein n=1 Tax=Micromonospora lupini TaxID=285679 RepID=UPI0006891A2A|nr:Pycsar system effector family protein [Micromonospora lupini]
MDDNTYFDSIFVWSPAFTGSMGNARRTARQPHLDPWRDLQVGLATVASLQTSIRHADTKAFALLAIEGGVAAAVVDKVVPHVVGGAPVTVLLAVLLVILFVIGIASAAWLLVLALRPRLDGARTANRFAFPNLVRGRGSPSAAPIRRHRDEVWDLVTVLARIAMAKHLRVRRSMPWLMVAMASAAGLMLLSTFSTRLMP